MTAFPASPRPRSALLGQNQYGKAETRVVKVTRDGDTHHIRDLNVSVALSGDMDEVHYSGSNAAVLPTDTTKNTVFAFAAEHGAGAPEQFGIRLARHFVTSQETIHRARVRVEEYAWDRIRVPGRGAHSFARAGQETRTCEITLDGESLQVVSGLTGLTVMNTTDSEFWGYIKDEYTTLQETYDRVLATEITACWRHAGTASDWDGAYRTAKDLILRAFAETYSLSLQQTLYEMGARVVDGMPDVEEIRFSLPNKHHFLVDLDPFGVKNDPGDGGVYFAADRPYGLIEATVLRDGAEARIPADMTSP